jgi:predicted aspartyl protease
MRNESQIPKDNTGKLSCAHGRVNHVSAETPHENPRVLFGMCLVTSAPASVLFDAGASHSFITSQCAAKLNIPMSAMPRPMLVSSTRGDMKALYRCNNVNLQISGKDFQADPIVLNSIDIDVVLGMGWLSKFNGEIRYAKKSVLLTSLDGE